MASKINKKREERDILIDHVTFYYSEHKCLVLSLFQIISCFNFFGEINYLEFNQDYKENYTSL